MTITTSLSSYVERESKNILLNVTTLFSERVNHCDNHCNLPASKIFWFGFVETAKLLSIWLHLLPMTPPTTPHHCTMCAPWGEKRRKANGLWMRRQTRISSSRVECNTILLGSKHVQWNQMTQYNTRWHGLEIHSLLCETWNPQHLLTLTPPEYALEHSVKYKSSMLWNVRKSLGTSTNMNLTSSWGLQICISSLADFWNSAPPHQYSVPVWFIFFEFALIKLSSENHWERQQIWIRVGSFKFVFHQAISANVMLTFPYWIVTKHNRRRSSWGWGEKTNTDACCFSVVSWNHCNEATRYI